MNRRIQIGSLEYVTATITATVAGTTHDPTSDAIAVQIIASGNDPASNGWTATTWEPGTGKARVLVGPGGTLGPFTAGFYDLYWKVTDNPEVPVIFGGTIQFY